MNGKREIISERELLDAPVLSLAFVGDAVHSLYIRQKKFGEAYRRNNELHDLCSKEVCAKKQAVLSSEIEKILTDEELFVFKKGKNAHVNSVPKHSDLFTYKQATAFETVLGYLYLSGQDERLSEIFAYLYEKE